MTTCARAALACILLWGSGGSPAAAESAGASHAEQALVFAAVRQFTDGFNAGNMQRAVTACAVQTAIIDEFPPHRWYGPGGCRQWWRDLVANNATQGITGARVTLGTPSHLEIDGNRAYVVVTASQTFMQRGKRVAESGSVFTLVLDRVAVGWRISAWAWAAGH